MKKFRFRLQVLLDQRQAKEDLLLLELAAFRCEETQQMEHLADLRARLQRAWDATAEAIRRNAPAGEMTLHDDYTKTLPDDIRVQTLTLEAVRVKVEAKRVEVVEAMKQRKVLEVLRDKQEREYVLAIARAEQNMLDEMASLRHARGM